MRFFTEKLIKRLKLMEKFPFVDVEYVEDNWTKIYKKLIKENIDQLHEEFLLEFPRLKAYCDLDGCFMSERGIERRALGKLTYEAAKASRMLDDAWNLYDEHLESIKEDLPLNVRGLAFKSLALSSILAISMVNKVLAIELCVGELTCGCVGNIKIIFKEVSSAEISSNVFLNCWYYEEFSLCEGGFKLNVLTENGVMEIIAEDVEIKNIR
ncbi:MAG: DUF4085 family protein [Acidaminobacteraceae bacterium]